MREGRPFSHVFILGKFKSCIEERAYLTHSFNLQRLNGGVFQKINKIKPVNPSITTDVLWNRDLTIRRFFGYT